ncbi:S8 family serine peptidase [Cesiribacter andamanensis]|uniref:Thermophilic serine proteinase n=1 Tax=Cesiribacter andamanensis AMV16 TaxID=1279009 RepID=M7NCD9_9BACT|nr:S8 family serine peptidase [Cesiribacter andamanensis]EMR04821.1 Thermophilic serine proteinase precursor [Cesiribacter andamanensis AMV16]
MYKKHQILFFLLLLCPFLLVAQPAKKKPQYEPGVVVFKLKEGYSSSTDSPDARKGAATPSQGAAERMKQLAGARALAAPFLKPATAKKGGQAQRHTKSVLDGIYQMELPEGLSVEEVVALLKLQPEVQYAEPYYLPELLETPNDPNFGSQSHLPIIKAPEAWAIQKGSRDIIIGILDTGVDFNHPDLQDNLHYNLNEIPNNGIDDDGDGFIDNYRGWDFANNDNNPQADQNGHGTLVTGVAAASTNNSTGVAGAGYNTRYMPIKVFSSKDGRFIRGYEAIAYAADMGCQIINLSWGSPALRSDFVQDIINYAVLEKDAVVVAAAGNEKREVDYYPASYTNVLSVTSSDSRQATRDYKFDGHSWSRFVDLSAPGNLVYATSNGGNYGSSGGTSFASPQVAAAAALIRAQYPELSALQVMERLRRSTDDISAIGNNAQFARRIGTGRLNMQKALAPEVGPSIRMDKFYYDNGFGAYAFHNDTLELWIDVTNYLDPSAPATVTLVSESPYATVLQSTSALSALGTLASASTKAAPFRIVLSPNLPALAMLSFRLDFDSGSYSDYQYFDLRSSGEYIDVTVNDLTLTVASNGNLGYNYDYNLQGLGLRYQNSPLAHNMGLLIGQKANAMANNMIFYNVPAIRDQDYKIQDRLRLYARSKADIDARSSFRTVVQDSVRLNLQIDQKILGWKDPSVAALVLEYRVINRSDSAYENLHVALFSDFNIKQFYLNRADWNADYQLGYTYDDSKNLYTGVALLTNQQMLYHAIDLNTREGNTADLGAIISRREKFGFISQGIHKTGAGTAGKGNDVAQVIGGSIANLLPYSAQNVAFAFVTASTLEELKAATLKAKEQYLNYRSTPPLIAHVTACAGQRVEITPREGTRYRFFADLEATDFIAEAETLLLPAMSQNKTIYAASMENGWAGELQRIEIEYAEPTVNFSMSGDKLTLNAGLDERIQFFGESEEATSWLWDFGNGFQSTFKEPVMQYTKAGTYQVRLTITTAAGCTATLAKTLTVIRLEDAPLAADQTVCAGEKALIEDSTGKPINVYADEALSELLYSGLSFESDPLTTTTRFYLTTGQGDTESLSSAITLYVPQNLSLFELAEEEVAFDPESPVFFTSTSTEAVRWEWNFGDGTSSDLQNPSHAYAEAGTYTITLTAYSAGGCMDVTEQTLVLTAPQGILNKPHALRLQLYPNPTPDQATITLPASLRPGARLLVLDASGRVVQQQPVPVQGQLLLSLEQQPAGIYLVRLMDGSTVWQSRLMRQ